MTTRTSRTSAADRVVRCAVYTRTAKTEGDGARPIEAQRNEAERCIRRRANQGWIVLPTRYDDAGFSGRTLRRPALRQLLADIEAGQIDVVVVHRIDCLTRSLDHFDRLLAGFARHKVRFSPAAFATHESAESPRVSETLPGHLSVPVAAARREKEK